MIVADEGARTLSLGVEDLLDAGEHGAGSGHDEAPGAGAVRAEYLAAAAASGARCAVALDVPVTWRDWTIHLSGTADVLRADARGTSLELLRVVPDGEGGGRALERAGLTALLLSYAGEDVARAAVLELALGGGSSRTDLVFKREAWEDLLRTRLHEVAHRAEVELGRARGRRAFELAFPFPEPRPVQETMLREATGAAASGLVLLCSAPTGVGKTAAALYPFLRDALANDRRVFFVTSRGSQQELALETLRRMLPAGGPALALQISAKERVCPQAQLGCVERRCPWGRRFVERLTRTGLLDSLETRGVVSAEEVAVEARAAELCPFEVTLRLAQRASTVVCDFNYVFDPRVALRHLLNDAGRDLLIVDEAHDLPDRARGALSPELDLERLETLGACLQGQLEAPYARAGELLRDVAGHARTLAERLGEERESLAPWVEPPARGFWEPVALRAAAAQAETQALVNQSGPRDPRLAPRREGRDARLRDPVQSALADVRDFAAAAEEDPDRFAALWSPERAALLCLDPAPWLGARIRSFHAALLMSATLAPLEHHARLLGVEGPRSLSLELPCPFPRENRRLVASTAVETRFRVRSENAAGIAATIARCTATRRGNWLAFFSSFAFRDEVVAHLPPGGPRPVLQLPGMPIEPIFARLRANRGRETLLVCGVHGGVLAEGVDYPGELAIGVFVVGPGLPKVDLERELVRAHFERETGAGFEYAYLVPGLARSVQAGGRVLRGPDDVAAIVLLDRRFAEPEYFERLPAWWRDEIVLSDDPARELAEFWRGGARERLQDSDA